MDEIDLWVAVADGDLGARWAGAVPESAGAEIAALHESARNRRIVQLALRRSVFASLLGCSVAEVCLSRAVAGPIVSPLADSAVSASHHDDITVLAVAGGPGPLGVDVEPLYEPDWEEALTGALCPREHSSLLQLPADQRAAAYFTTWTRKEAVMKALGEGLSDRDPQSVEVSVAPAPAQLLALDGAEVGSGWSLCSLQVGRHVCSLARPIGASLAPVIRHWPVDLDAAIR